MIARTATPSIPPPVEALRAPDGRIASLSRAELIRQRENEARRVLATQSRGCAGCPGRRITR